MALAKKTAKAIITKGQTSKERTLLAIITTLKGIRTQHMQGRGVTVVTPLPAITVSFPKVGSGSLLNDFPTRGPEVVYEAFYAHHANEHQQH